MMVVRTQKTAETKHIAALLAEEMNAWSPKGARVVALVGDLGAGKTTFVQWFARALGIKETVHSPTFVILKTYHVQNTKYKIRHVVHIDCYRISSPKELIHLGFKELVRDKDAVILVEWADRIRSLLPKDALWIRFEHGEEKNERFIKFQMSKSK